MTTKNTLSERLRELRKSKSFQEKSAHYGRMIILGAKIYGRRKDLGMSQDELASKSGTTQRIVSELENGNYASSSGIGEDLYDRLGKALQIDRDYLFSEKIDRRTFELYAYLYQKAKKDLDIMQFMKLPYFVDLNAVKELGFQITNLEYIRWEYGPFDKKIYAYRSLFEGKKPVVKFTYIGDFLPNIDKTLQSLPIDNGEKLKELSYETAPMKKFRSASFAKKGLGEKLDLSCSK